MKKNTKQEKGQVVLMVLLASALILTLGLSASKQATVETKIDTDQELLKKAFNTAESGIEYYLGTGQTNYSNNDGSLANLSVKSVGDSESLSFGNVIPNGSTDYFWLVKHNNDGTLSTDSNDYYSSNASSLNICTTDGSDAQFMVEYFYRSGTTYNTKNSILTTTNGCISKFSLAGGDSVLLGIIPIGFSPKIKLTGSAKFPSQGEEIRSTGLVQGINNTVTVLNKYTVPLFLLEAVTSGGDVTNK